MENNQEIVESAELNMKSAVNHLETELAKQYNELSKNINTAFWFFELLWR